MQGLTNFVVHITCNLKKKSHFECWKILQTWRHSRKAVEGTPKRNWTSKGRPRTYRYIILGGRESCRYSLLDRKSCRYLFLDRKSCRYSLPDRKSCRKSILGRKVAGTHFLTEKPTRTHFLTKKLPELTPWQETCRNSLIDRKSCWNSFSDSKICRNSFLDRKSCRYSLLYGSYSSKCPCLRIKKVNISVSFCNFTWYCYRMKTTNKIHFYRVII